MSDNVKDKSAIFFLINVITGSYVLYRIFHLSRSNDTSLNSNDTSSNSINTSSNSINTSSNSINTSSNSINASSNCIDELTNSNNNSSNDKVQKYINGTLIRDRFKTNGYVFVSNSLIATNTELNNLIELIKNSELRNFDGCNNPLRCDCKFRYKNSKTFIIRQYSWSDKLIYYSPKCVGFKHHEFKQHDLTDISISNNTQLHQFIQIINNSYSLHIFNLVDYIRYITDPDMKKKYIVDISLISDIKNTISESSNKCIIKWHRESYTDISTDKVSHYDIIAQFILSCDGVTPHNIMIGSVNDIDTNQNNIVKNVNEHLIENGIGYIVDQRRDFVTRHSDYNYTANTSNGHRNIISIAIKYF
jgi:hypothetical protein